MKTNTDKTARYICRSVLGLCVWWLLAVNAAAQPGPATVAFDLAGKAVSPFENQTARVIVLVFLRTDCPISNRYAPELQRLRKQFKPSEVRWWYVYSNDETVAIQKHLKAYGLAKADALRDPQHTLVKQFGITVTPEATVFIHEQKDNTQIYRGRIDNRVIAFGKQRPAATQHDLVDTLNAVLRGQTPSFKSQPAIGCYITTEQ